MRMPQDPAAINAPATSAAESDPSRRRHPTRAQLISVVGARAIMLLQ